MTNWLYKIWHYCLVFICLLAAVGGTVYKIYALNNFGVFISLALTICGLAIFIFFDSKNNKNKISANNVLALTLKKNNQWINFLLLTFYFLLLTTSFLILFKSRTANAIVSPWQVIPAYFFIIYGVATAILFALIWRGHQLSLLCISLHYFLTFSVALIIYKFGYGFDPFIHRATVGLINAAGAVEPKPFYYLGQYALITILHKITFLPINWLDKLLVPALAAATLPWALTTILKQWFDDKTKNYLTIVVLLIIPCSFFIVTTPQNLAYLFLLLAIIFGLACQKLPDLILVYLLAAAALVTQAVAGLPALAWAGVLTIYHSELSNKIKKILLGVILFLTVIALPLAFYVVEKNNQPAETEITTTAAAAAAGFNFSVPGQENFILNFVYLYGFNISLIILGLAAIGVAIAWRHRAHCRVFSLNLLLAGALLISYLLITLLPFKFLISYERGNYANRILLVAAFFLLPFILTALYGFIAKLLTRQKFIKISFGIFGVLIITASLYLAYPRLDRYFNSRGYSVGQADLDAVRWIHYNTKNDYIVLANQQVSAAALQEFGFTKYYNNNIFYYPIPTGGPLYPFYLDMVYKQPSRATMFSAMDLVDVKESYFVLNKYWWAFPKVLDEAKNSADSWEKFGNGEVYVFKYIK